MSLLHANRYFRSIVTTLSLTAGVVAAGAASAQTVLSYSPWLPQGYAVNEVIYPWMEKVEEVTEGRVRIQPRAAAVGSPKAQFDVVRDGLADVSLIVPGYTQGRFPLMEIGELPLLSSDASVLAPTFYRLYQEHLAEFKPYAGTHVVAAWMLPSSQLATNHAIDSLDDLEGLKIYTSSAVAALGLESIGAVPVTASIAETYTMASAGIIDGTLNPYEPLLTWNLYPFFKHITDIPGGMTQAGMALLINEPKWNSISEKDRRAIMKLSEPMVAELGRILAEGERQAVDELREKGVTITQMPPELFAEFAKRMEPVYETWYAKAKKAGMENPKQMLADFRAELKAAEKQ